jgi:hypothetical protein
MRRLRLHRATFTAAGMYNIAWAATGPSTRSGFFRLTGLPSSNSPQIFACLHTGWVKSVQSKCTGC